MRIVSLNPNLPPINDTPSQRGRGLDTSDRHDGSPARATQRSAHAPVARWQVTDALRRFVALDNQLNADGLPVGGRRAIEAYVGTAREEEKRFLHDTMGIDTYA